MNRLYTLDYLRGIVAFGIMMYHYLIWTTGKFGPDTFMGRVGIYGVSIFYVLSGLTLYYVYYDKMKPTQPEIISFVKKRIFRIFPLLWLVTISAILLSRKSPNFYDLFLNLSGLFGFVKWDIYFSAGVWSIGNELVFYFFFPFFILFAKSFRPYFILFSVVLFSIYLYFAFIKLNPEKTLGEQWSDYVNPLNQIFLFLGGFLIGLFFSMIKLRNSLIIALFFMGLGLFTFVPTQGETINLVTGYNRLFFTFCCLLICFCFYKLTIKLPGYIHKPLTLLGEASYSIYLLHPIVYELVRRSRNYTLDFSDNIQLIISIFITLVAAYFTYEYFEKFFMNLAKQRIEKR